jgi:hypothetical protein
VSNQYRWFHKEWGMNGYNTMTQYVNKGGVRLLSSLKLRLNEMFTNIDEEHTFLYFHFLHISLSQIARVFFNTRWMFSSEVDAA